MRRICDAPRAVTRRRRRPRRPRRASRGPTGASAGTESPAAGPADRGRSPESPNRGEPRGSAHLFGLKTKEKKKEEIQ